MLLALKHCSFWLQVSEQGLIEILEKVSQQTEKKTTVKFNRRKVMDSDEDDDY